MVEANRHSLAGIPGRVLPDIDIARLVHANRLALLMFAANLLVAGGRARNAAAVSAARWLSGNGRTIRMLLVAFTLVARCAGQAGYRVIQAGRRPFRRRRAPRLLRHRLGRRVTIRVARLLSTVWERPRLAVSTS